MSQSRRELNNHSCYIFCVGSLRSPKYHLGMSSSHCCSSGFITAGTERTGDWRLDNTYDLCVCVCFKRHMTPLLRISWTVLLQFSSIAQLCPTLCDPMDCSMPGFPVHHPLLELTQNSCSSNQWCHPTISSCVIPFPPAFSLSYHQGLFQWGSNTTYLTTYIARKQKIVSLCIS